MKCTKSDQAYKWHDGRQWHVGKLVMDKVGNRFSWGGGATRGGSDEHQQKILVCHSHTGELEFVEWSKLSVYEPEKKPEPSTAASARGE